MLTVSGESSSIITNEGVLVSADYDALSVLDGGSPPVTSPKSFE